MGASFKAKFMGAPSSWSGFCVPREKLNVGDDDVTYVESLYGSAIRLVTVEYKSLGSICFKCGRLGNNKDFCREWMSDSKDNSTDDMEEVMSAKGDSYGPWLHDNDMAKNQVNNMKAQGLPKTQSNTVNSTGGKAGESSKFSKGDIASTSDVTKNAVVAPSKLSVKMGKLSSSKSSLQGTGGSQLQVLESDVDVLLEDISKGHSSANMIFSKPRALSEITNTKGSLYSGSNSSKKIIRGTVTGVSIQEEAVKKKKGKSKGKRPLAIHLVLVDVMEKANVLQQLHCDVMAAKNRENVLSKSSTVQMHVDSEQVPYVEDGLFDEEIVDVAIAASNLKEVDLTFLIVGLLIGCFIIT
ncbi:hypothetical protein ACOSP7_020725 [Xanthoceras sorbifolium]